MVLPRGVWNADTMIVGECPGREEDELGLPFVGMSGKLLKKLMAHVSVDIDKCYITNVVKCRKPNNKTPTIKEIEFCGSTWLKKEIDTVKPSVIIALGKSAASFLLDIKPNKIKIGDILGKPVKYGESTLYVLYHPSYLLQHGRKMIKLQEKALETIFDKSI